MISKNHRQNHDFQILHFLVGSCHTPDAAYALLCDLREERILAIQNYRVTCLRQQAKRLAAEKVISDGGSDEPATLMAQADLLEVENELRHGEVLYAAAEDELRFIDRCIAEISPRRKYAHLPDNEAHEAMQREEWKLELIDRAKNMLLTSGTIQYDHFATMQSHPDFRDCIMPAIKSCQKAMSANLGMSLMENSQKINLLEQEKK